MRHSAELPCLALAAVGWTAGDARSGSGRTRRRKRAGARPRRTPSRGQAVAGPKIEVNPETKDAGTVAKGQVIETTFVVKNNGGSDLIITDARPGCGCTVASFDKVVKPGAEGKVISSVDTKTFSGPISKSILLVSNDPERPQLNLFIKAIVKPFVDVLPQRATCGSRSSRATATRRT